jgi:chromosomal replication initiation ATPase DnaA
MTTETIALSWDIVEDDLWEGIPSEFHGAVLSQGAKDLLGQKPRPASFAIVGPPGTGKTRLLWAIVCQIRRRRLPVGSPIEPWYRGNGELTRVPMTRREARDRMIENVEGARIITEVGEIRAKRYDRAALDQNITYEGWLCIDDIGAIEPNEWVREALYHLANERRAHNRTTVWTSNLTPPELRETFGGAIASRILGGAVIETDGADRRLVDAQVSEERRKARRLLSAFDNEANVWRKTLTEAEADQIHAVRALYERHSDSLGAMLTRLRLPSALMSTMEVVTQRFTRRRA